MTNFEKYKTELERAEAYKKWVTKNYTADTMPIEVAAQTSMSWLDLEAEEEKPLPCPFCGGDVYTSMGNETVGYEWDVFCNCGYRTKRYKTKDAAIAAHNRVAKAVMDAKAKEVNDGR